MSENNSIKSNVGVIFFILIVATSLFQTYVIRDLSKKLSYYKPEQGVELFEKISTDFVVIENHKYFVMWKPAASLPSNSRIKLRTLSKDEEVENFIEPIAETDKAVFFDTASFGGQWINITYDLGNGRTPLKVKSSIP